MAETANIPMGAPTSLMREYEQSRPISRAIFERATRTLPGAETRAVTHYWPFPSVVERGNGPVLRDVDGHEYLDVVNNYTSLIHGNAHPAIVAAQMPVLESGAAFAALHPIQLELAEVLVERIASVAEVRFTNSGSEASALAARIARRATGRRQLVMIEGGYHGGVDPFLKDSPDTVRIRYNVMEDIDLGITDRTAAVFVEPFLGAGGVIPGDPEFLLALARRAREVGAVFVLDEVQSLRNSHGGMQSLFGLAPDLTTVGKIIGGGLPIGAVGGRAELLEQTSPLVPDRLEHSGTFNGSLPAAAGGLIALELLDEAAISRLDERAHALAAHIETASRAARLPVTVTRAGSILNVHPGEGPVLDPDQGQRHPSMRAALHLALLESGVYATPRGMLNLSTALSDDHLDRVADGYRHAFDILNGCRDELELLEGAR